jgi:hypothetical protein
MCALVGVAYYFLTRAGSMPRSRKPSTCTRTRGKRPGCLLTPVQFKSPELAHMLAVAENDG